MLQAQDTKSARATGFPFFSSSSVPPAVSAEPAQPQAFLNFALSMHKYCMSIFGLSSVKKIGFKARGESISAWVFVEEPTTEELAKIYDSEMILMDTNPHLLFDFAVKFDNSPEPPGFYIIMGK